MSNKVLLGILVASTILLLFGCISQKQQEFQPRITSSPIVVNSSNLTSTPTFTVPETPTPTFTPTTTNPANIVKPSIGAEIYIVNGDVHFQSRQYDKAIENYQKAIEINPDNDRAHHKLGIVYFNLGLYATAIENYTKAIDINPNKIEAYHGRGIVYGMQSEYQKSITDLTKALQIDKTVEATDSRFPLRANIYHNRGFIYLHLEEYQKSLADFEKAIEINPGYTQAINSRKSLLDSGILEN